MGIILSWLIFILNEIGDSARDVYYPCWVVQPLCRRNSLLVLTQTDVPCFADNYGRPAPSLMETEVEFMGRVEANWETEGEEGEETVV